MKKKIFSLTLMSLMLFGMVMSIPLTSAFVMDETPGQNSYKGSLAGNESREFHFRNQNQFRLQTNTSLQYNISCDEQLRAQNMTMTINTTQNRLFTMQMNRSRLDLGLEKGNTVRVQSQNAYAYQYQYKEGAILDLELNGTGDLDVELGMAIGDQSATWAYYHEGDNLWIPVQSRYENQFLYANTNHFSIWTILTPNVSVEMQNISVNANQYQARLLENQSYRLTFRNSFNFQFQANATMDLDMDVDVDAIGDRNFTMNFTTTQTMEMTMKINGSAEQYGLTNGSQVQIQTQDQYRYRFLEGMVFQFELNESAPMQAELRLTTQNQNTVWAYYDEEEEVWVPVESQYQNGELIANTDHFSLWTVLTYDEDNESSSIPGFPISIFLGFLGIAAAILLRKRVKLIS